MKWLPIETCPIKPFDKDRWFLPHSDNVLLYAGFSVIGSYSFTEKGKGRWRSWNGAISPTHWMLLPPPPEKTE